MSNTFRLLSWFNPAYGRVFHPDAAFTAGTDRLAQSNASASKQTLAAAESGSTADSAFIDRTPEQQAKAPEVTGDLGELRKLSLKATQNKPLHPGKFVDIEFIVNEAMFQLRQWLCLDRDQRGGREPRRKELVILSIGAIAVLCLVTSMEKPVAPVDVPCYETIIDE